MFFAVFRNRKRAPINRAAFDAQAQAEGRGRWYAEYTMYAASDPRTHRFVAMD